MPKFKPKDIGKYRRDYDNIIDFEGEDEMSLEELLVWATELQPEDEADNDTMWDKIRHEVKSWFYIETKREGSVFFGINTAHPAVGLPGKAAEAFDEYMNAARDLLSFRQIRTRITVLSTITAGALIGFAIGTLIFPGVGSVLGGAAGVSAATLFELLGGAGGLAILGGFGGSRAGNWLAKKIFKNEKHYELRVKFTNKLEQKYGIRSDLAHLINGYLYNRSKQVTNERCKKIYKNLRILAIERAHPSAVDRMARFFVNELVLLQKERPSKGNEAAYNQEVETVQYILKSLLSPETKLHAETKAKLKLALYPVDKVNAPKFRSPEIAPRSLSSPKMQLSHTLEAPQLNSAPAVGVPKDHPKGILVQHQNRHVASQLEPHASHHKQVRFSVGSHFTEYDSPAVEPLSLDTVRTRVIQSKSRIHQALPKVQIGDVVSDENGLHIPVNNSTLTITQQDQRTDTGTYHNLIYDVSPDVLQNVHTHEAEKKDQAVEVLKANFWLALVASEPGTELAVGKSFKHIVSDDFIRDVLSAHKSELSEINEKNLHIKCGDETFSISHLIARMKSPGAQAYSV